MKLIIFDKDQTLVDSACGKKFIQHPQDQMILPGAAEAVQSYHNWGFKIAIASNQGGVEKRKKTLEFAIEEMRYCLSLFPEIEVGIFAPTYDGLTAWKVWRDPSGFARETEVKQSGFPPEFGSFRKPGAGMINLIFEHFNLQDLIICRSQAWFVGDRPEDEQAAEAAGVDFMDADIVRARFFPGFEVEMVCKKIEPTFYKYHQN